MAYADMPTVWDANTTVVPKSMVPEGYQGMISMPLSDEEKAAQVSVQQPTAWGFSALMSSLSAFGNTVGNVVGLTTDANKAASEGGLLSTPSITGMVKSALGSETSADEKVAASSAGAAWERWGNETFTRLAVLVVALMLLYFALRKMM